MTRILIIAAAAASMLACLSAPALYFLGRLSPEGYRTLLLLGSAGWFACSVRLAGFDHRFR